MVTYTAEIVKIGDLLSRKRSYRVPAFQRPYSWTRREIDRLLANLAEKLADSNERGEASGPYSLGHMVHLAAEPVPPRGLISLMRPQRPAGPVEIVDGKQRLITISIIIAVLRDLLGASGSDLQGALVTADGRPRVDLSGEEADFCRTFVIAPGSARRPVPPGQRSKGAKNLRAARRIVRRELDHAGWPRERLLGLAKLVTESCVVNITETDDLANAYQIFEACNGTGLPLTPADLMRATLIGALPAEQRETYHKSWIEMETRLGSGAFDELFSHIKTMETPLSSPIAAEIPRIARARGIEAFFEQTLFPAARDAEMILQASHQGAAQSGAINRHFVYLGWLRSRDWMPPLLAYLRRRNDPERLLSFLGALDRFAYGQLLTRLGTERRRARYRALIDWIAAGEPGDAAASPLELSREEQRTACANAAGNLYRRGSATCKLVLLRLCDTYPGSEPPRQIARISVEHVLPQNIGGSAYWRERFPDAEERERLVRSIANLALLPRSQNDAARNRPWPEKRSVYFAEGKETPFAITNALQPIEHWTPDVLREREADLLARLARLWRLEAPAGGPKRSAHG